MNRIARNTITSWITLILTSAISSFPVLLFAQNADYEVPGIVAWSTAKTYGFTFRPEAASGESVSQPLDGMNTRLTKKVQTLLTTQTITIAQVVGGQPSVNPNQRNTTFTMFGARTIQPGWTVKSVDIGGNFTYVQQPRLGTSDPSFRVRLAPGGSATLRKIVLTGPAGSNWQDAFSAPARKDYVINGVVAWNAAKKYGFTFSPQKTYDKSFIDGPPDGVATRLMVPKTSEMNRCETAEKAGTMPGIYINPSPDCIVGQVVGGNMSVMPALEGYKSSQAVSFAMFGAKKLSPGWIVKSVTASAGSWKRQPVYGTEDLLFILTVTSYGTNSASAIIPSITLEGPSNAVSFEDAFKMAQNR